MPAGLAADNRGLATGIILFIGILVLVALLYALINPVMSGAEASLDNATTTADAQGVVDSRLRVWDNLLLYFVLLGGMLVIGRAVFESRGGR